MKLAQLAPTTSNDVSNPIKKLNPEATPEAPLVRPEKDRILGLDGLRGIAAFGVMLFHFTTLKVLRGDSPFTFHYGSYGVHLFFLISGFVIFMSVERSRRPLEFAKSRFARLYPAFWLSLTVCVLLNCTTRGAADPLSWGQLVRRTIVNITMVPGWFHVGALSGVYWTLGVEMTFYTMIFAILCLKRLEWTIPILTGVVALGIVDEFTNLYWPNRISPWLRSSLALDYIPFLVLGILLYKVRRAFRPSYVFVAAFCLLALFLRPASEFYNPSKEVIITTILALVVYLATTNRLRFLEWRPLVFLGTISYSLYLNHQMIGERIFYYGDRVGFSHGSAIAASMLVSLAVAILVTFQIELPIREALRRRLGREKTPTTQPTAKLPAQSVLLSVESVGLSDICPG